MAKRVGVDKWLFGTVLLLVLFGLVSVFSASAVMAQQTTGSPYSFVTKQAVFALVGLVALFVLMRIDYRRYNNPKLIFTLMGVTGILLMAVIVLHGKVNGAHRWIPLGPATVQPSELAKPVIVLFLAWWLQTRIHKMDDLKETLLPALLPPVLYIGLILLEPDLGTAMVCAAVLMLMLYLAGMQMKWIGVAAACAAPVMYWMLFHVPWRLKRFFIRKPTRRARAFTSCSR
jgi:cell division protein FtsW